MEIYNGKKTHSTFHDNSTNIKKNNDKKKEGLKKIIRLIIGTNTNLNQFPK